MRNALIGVVLVLIGIALLWRPDGNLSTDMVRGVVGAPALAIGIAMVVGARWITTTRRTPRGSRSQASVGRSYR